MKKNNKGFTLAELLIVVAIIAVLVAIAIPVFNATLERSREATDAANIRSAYSEAMTNFLSSGEGGAKVVKMKQQVKEWSTNPDWPEALAGAMAGSDAEVKDGDNYAAVVISKAGKVFVKIDSSEIAQSDADDLVDSNNTWYPSDSGTSGGNTSTDTTTDG